ncbi:MAG: Wzz/FepE/Etk N-terminal domain-containing protein [Candidatus Saccharibacteria bacterium]|nr:hypothetical protein [Candidatus Saccharibacteria bacterium]MDO4967629.1 Wzz/FepE/Etk N-terminal domain-containing protein [Candidatus Saccharibacteria bacterium]
MEEINFKELSLYLVQKIWLILIILAAVVSGGEVYTNLIKTPMYSSSTNVVLISDSSSTKQITYNDVTLSNNLVKTYSEIVKSRNVLNQVKENLELDESYEALASKVSVSSVTSTQLITIKVSDKNNERAELIANEIGSVFKEEIKNIYGIDNVQIVDKAVKSDSPYNISVVKETIIYIVAGLILGIGVGTLLYMLDKTVKDTETVEKKLGLTVVGVVPKVEA